MPNLEVKKKSQKEQIKQYLLTGKELTPLEALEKFGCFRLGARIWDLRHEGYDIQNIGADEGQWAVYQMKVAAPVLPPAFDPKPEDTQPSLL